MMPSTTAIVRNASRLVNGLMRSSHSHTRCLSSVVVAAASSGERVEVGTSTSSVGGSSLRMQYPVQLGPVRFLSDKASGEGADAAETKKQDEEKKDEEAATSADGEGEAAAGEAGDAEEAPEGPSKEEQLEAEVKDLKDQLLRSLAEQDNTRRIAQRDVDSARQFAIKSFAKSLLEVSDNLTRALEAVPEEARKDKDGNPILANLYEGIEMTDQGLAKAFEMNGLKKYGEPGEPFDPNKHDALFEYVDAEKEAGTIGQVMKPGFLLNDRVLRPAEVGVIKKE